MGHRLVSSASARGELGRVGDVLRPDLLVETVGWVGTPATKVFLSGLNATDSTAIVAPTANGARHRHAAIRTASAGSDGIVLRAHHALVGDPGTYVTKLSPAPGARWHNRRDDRRPAVFSPAPRQDRGFRAIRRLGSSVRRCRVSDMRSISGWASRRHFGVLASPAKQDPGPRPEHGERLNWLASSLCFGELGL